MGNVPTEAPLLRIFLICLLLIIGVPDLMSITGAHDQEPEAAEKAWLNIHAKTEKKVITTELDIYFHDTVSGKNPTAVMVAKAENSLVSSTLFGTVIVIDDKLTVGPEPSSEIVGRAQGLYVMADQQELGVFMCMTFVFTGGDYNGSTLSILGKNPLSHEHREMPVIGGTGVFSLAQGIATAKTYSFNKTSKNAVVEYHVVILHYSNLL